MKFTLLLVGLTIFHATIVAAQDDYPLLKGYPPKTMSGSADTSRRVKFSTGVEALRTRVRTAVKEATANVASLKHYDDVMDIGSLSFLNDRDTTIPLTFNCKFFPGNEAIDEAIKGDSTLLHDKKRLALQFATAEVELHINPASAARFRITGPFTTVDVPGATYAIRVDQQLPFTVVFLGAFSEILADRKEDRPKGNTRYPSLIASPKYDRTLSYLEVQSIYVVIRADAESAREIIEQMDFAALIELITKD